MKYEDIYLQGYEDLRSLKKGVGVYFRFYNQERFHQSLDYETLNMRYESFQEGCQTGIQTGFLFDADKEEPVGWNGISGFQIFSSLVCRRLLGQLEHELQGVVVP